jgi:hypothetical protein
MNALYLAGTIHLTGLAAFTALTVKRLFADVAPRVCAAFLLIWANLAYTALLLSLFSQLGNRWLYFSSSLLLALASWKVVSRLISEPLIMIDGATRFRPSGAQRFFGGFLIATLCVAAACTLIICVRYYPDNWDTLAYRFSRVFFYLGHGNLLHFSKSSDVRALAYPFNNTLLYLLPALYHFDGRTFNLVSFACWGISALGVYLMARVVGASKLGALLAAWLSAMAPIVLCEGASTNDDMIAAVPMLLGSAFAYRAVQRWSRRCAILAGLGFGLGLGSKLHWAFFVPLGAVLAVSVCAYSLWRKGLRAELGEWRHKLPALAIAAGLATPLASDFLVCNYLSNAPLMPPLNDALNRPFRLDVAQQQILLYSAQLLLSSIPDVQIHLDPAVRRRTYDEFDRWTNQHWFRSVNQGPAFMFSSYRFQGIADPIGYWYFEQTLWLGFVPLLMVFLLIAAAVLRSLPTGMSALFLAFAAWHLSYATQSKYFETVGAYYSYPAILTAAGFGLAWDALQSRKHIVHSLLICGIGVAMAAQLLIDCNLLTFNVQRNIPNALQTSFDGESSVTKLAEPALRAIRSAQQIHIPYLHWEVLYWNFIRRNPGAIYTTGSDVAVDPRTLNLFSVFNDGPYLIGRSPDPAPPALTYLGSAWNGYVFGKGAAVERENPEANHYFLIRGDLSRRPNDHSISRFRLDSHTILGQENDTALEFRVVSSAPNGRHWTSPWLTNDGGTRVFDMPSGENWTGVIVESRWRSNRRLVCAINQTTNPFSIVLYKDTPTTDAHTSPPVDFKPLATGAHRLHVRLPGYSYVFRDTRW